MPNDQYLYFTWFECNIYQNKVHFSTFHFNKIVHIENIVDNYNANIYNLIYYVVHNVSTCTLNVVVTLIDTWCTHQMCCFSFHLCHFCSLPAWFCLFAHSKSCLILTKTLQKNSFGLNSKSPSMFNIKNNVQPTRPIPKVLTLFLTCLMNTIIIVQFYDL